MQQASNSVSALEAHKTIVSIGVLIIVAIILTSVAGTSNQAADVVLWLAVGIVIALAVAKDTNLANFSNSYPWIP